MIDKPSSKTSLRCYYRGQRRAISASKQRLAAQRLAQQLPQLPIQAKARVSAYISCDGEINPLPLLKRLQRLGIQIYLPIAVAKQQPLIFSPMPISRYLLGSGLLGIPIPVKRKRIQAQLLNTLLVPLVAFDRRLNRLGMGGGFYDRTLAQTGCLSKNKPLTIGLAHSCQFSKVQLPVEKTDQTLHKVITPERIFSHKSNHLTHS